MLALPYAMDSSGCVGLAALLAVAALMGASACLIGMSLNAAAEHPDVKASNPPRDWALLGKLAFGGFGKGLLSFLMLLDLSGALVTFMVIISVNLPLLIPALSSSNCAMASGILIFALLYAPLKIFAYFSMLGVMIQVMLFSFLVVTGVVVAWSNPSAVGQDIQWGSFGALTSVLGVLIGSFNAHSVIPTLYGAVQDKSEWVSISIISTATVWAFYFIVAFVAYALFGDGIAASFATNLGKDSAGSVLPPHRLMAFMAPVAGGLISLKMSVTAPAMARPILSFFEARFRLGPVGDTLFRLTLISAVTLLAVLGRDYMPYIIAIRGAAVHSIMAGIMPFAVYLIVCWDRLGMLARAGLFGIMVVSYGCTLPGSLADFGIIFFGTKAS